MQPDFIAVKRLTASDLTFFESQFRKSNSGNQKSINLNADVLTGELYPGLESSLDPETQELRVRLELYGPGAAPEHRITRKIIKGGSYKNWRLDGEFVPDPVDQAGRYGSLQPGDLAIIAFDGRPAPTRLRLVLLAGNDPADMTLHAAVSRLALSGRRSMVSLTPEQLTLALADAPAGQDIPDTHPLFLLTADPLVDQALLDVAEGGVTGIGILDQRRPGRPVTKAELDKAKQSANAIGLAGEKLIHDHLLATVGLGTFVWDAASNAISPFDFSLLTGTGGARARIDVKSTGGDFAAAFHMSMAEVLCATDSDVPYYIYRVFLLDKEGGQLRISDDMRPFAMALRHAHDGSMPSGTAADSFAIRVDAPGLAWGASVNVRFRDDDPDDVQAEAGASLATATPTA